MPESSVSGTPSWAAASVVLICAVTVVRIMLTHAIFSPTYDEPLHVAAGYQYLSDHPYRTGTDNPPLARAVFAWPLRNARLTAIDPIDRVGELYESAGSYMKGVALSRRGNVVFVVIAIVATYLLAAEFFGAQCGVLAALILAMLPVTLAHGGLATTDLPGTAAFAVALFALVRWLDRTNWARTVGLAFAIAFLLLTKFTCALFFAIGAAALMLAYRRFPLRRGVAAVVVALAVVYAVYGYAHAAPRFLIGVRNVIQISGRGQDAYLLGEVRHTGWWYYFPVVLAVKTPIPLLLLAAFAMRKREHAPLTALVVVSLAVMMTTRSDLGVRHVLPLYVPLSILAANATRSKWAWPLFAWLIVGSFAAHPDYLPWMNAFAGPHPERVVVDSNFDWGQDVVRLRDACRARHVDRIGLAIFGTVDMRRLGMPPVHPIDPHRPAPGWYAVSESFIIPAQVRDPRAYAWLTSHTFTRIGKTIRLYLIPPSAGPPPALR